MSSAVPLTLFLRETLKQGMEGRECVFWGRVERKRVKPNRVCVKAFICKLHVPVLGILLLMEGSHWQAVSLSARLL